MRKNLFVFALISLFSFVGFAQQKDIEFKVQDNEKTLSVICYNNSDATQEVTLTIKDIKGLKGYSKPIKKIVSPNSNVLFIDLTYEYVYSYKLAYSKKKIVTEEEKANLKEQKESHYLKDVSKINEGIVIFDDIECARCSYATNYMMEHNIDFKIVNISNNKQNLDLMWNTIREKGKSMNVKTPVIMVNGELSHSHDDLQQFLQGLK